MLFLDSDGVIRVFTTAPERMAEESEQKAFEEQLSQSTIPAQIGDIKTDELLGPEALMNPGMADGNSDNEIKGRILFITLWVFCPMRILWSHWMVARVNSGCWIFQY